MRRRPSRTIRVKRLWLNVFNDILGDAVDKYYKTLTDKVSGQRQQQAEPGIDRAAGEEVARKEGEDEDEAEFDAREYRRRPGRARRGQELRDDHRFLFEQGQTATLNQPFTRERRQSRR